jgi:serine O-acetyltransferase
MMRSTLSHADLHAYCKSLLAHHFPDGADCTSLTLPAVDHALQRIEFCFSRISRKYYSLDGAATFDHLNGDHMVSFLYFLANGIWKQSGDQAVPTKLFYLNKVMHGLDLFYSVSMPDIFMVVHPLGTVLGNAKYSDYFVVYQNCTVGAVGVVYPSFEPGVVMYSRSSVLGDCRIGNDVVLAANAFIVDTSITGNSIVVGHYPSHRVLKNPMSVKARCFDPPAG